MIMAASLFGLAAIGCFAAALWIHFAVQIGQLGAALAVGLSFSVLCLAILGIGTWYLNRKFTPVVKSPAHQIQSVDVQKIFNANKGNILIAAAVIGMVLADSQRKK